LVRSFSAVLGRLGRLGVGMVHQKDHYLLSSLAVQYVAGNGLHALQGAGLQVRLAGDAVAIEALLQGAIDGRQGQGGDEFRHHRALPGGQQQPGQAGGGDALVAGQAGAVVQHQFRKAQAPRCQPGADGGIGILAPGRLPAPLGAEGEEQLAGHDVVGELVDVPHHFRQGRRFDGGQGPGAGGHRPFPHLPLPAAAQLAPELGEDAAQILVVGEKGQVPGALAAAGRITAGKYQAPAAAVLAQVCPQLFPPVAAAIGRQAQQAQHLQVRRRRLGQDLDAAPARVRHQGQAYRLEVQQQGVGAHVVGPHRLVVEGGRIVDRRCQQASVHHQVAGDLADTAGTQLAQEQPELLEGELGIGAAPDHQVTAEDAVLQGRRAPGRGLPGVGRAQQFQGGEGGHQLHQRGGVAGLAGVDAQARGGSPGFLDHQGHGGRRDLGGSQGLGHRRRQPVLGRRHRGGEGEQQQAESGAHGAHLTGPVVQVGVLARSRSSAGRGRLKR